MGKLTIYLPDELAARVRNADLPASAICQEALAIELAGPRVSMGRGGWCRVKLPDAEIMVRFGRRGDAVELREIVVASSNLTTPALAAVPVNRLLAWANGPVREGILQSIAERSNGLDADQRAQASERAEWGTDAEAEADLCELLSR